MRICTDSKQLRKAIKEVAPSKIAVAFVGGGWKRYVSSARLKEIIISPTIGSNPKAIEEIMDFIGAKNVHFLDNLHSKIYLGSESALLGSVNLSDNGFADSHNFESGVVLNDAANLELLNDVFEAYKASAKRLYPTEKSKKDKLQQLMKQWQIMEWNNLNTERDSNTSPSITEYKSDLDRIHLAWYQPAELNYNKKSINGAIPDAIGLEPDDYFEDALMFHEEDSVQKGDWVLCWQCRNDGLPYENGPMYWMPVHHVVPNGFCDDTYTKLVGKEKNLTPLADPFRLDKTTKKAIRAALCSGKFPALVSRNADVWRLTPADKVVPKFLDHVRSIIKGGNQDI
ncbi:hypothetical protein GALL_167380 [mine drainage metagenome]|uniref:Phospholipase D-like domain-containing protein n=1 Tax=mine drainage metagenome TaxID=410659 RepID=A0A1J5RZI1_9ZZZZ